jgi:hypothetical protein
MCNKCANLVDVRLFFLFSYIEFSYIASSMIKMMELFANNEMPG